MNLILLNMNIPEMRLGIERPDGNVIVGSETYPWNSHRKNESRNFALLIQNGWQYLVHDQRCCK